MVSKKVLVIDDEPEIRTSISKMLENIGNYDVSQADGYNQGVTLLKRRDFDFVICDYYLEEAPELSDPAHEGRRIALDLLDFLKESNISTNFIVISGQADAAKGFETLLQGAAEYLPKPVTKRHLQFVLHRVERYLELEHQNRLLRKNIEDRFSFSNIIAKSPAMERIFEVIDKVKDYKTTVLITGESGTGKELVAKALHYNSIRKDRPFVAVNCGGIPENLLESEFFGHVKGAFTDAVRSKKGLFQEADGGTIFLDELGDLPMPLQVKLLRVLQDQEIRPVGSNESIKVDVRVVAATAKDLGRLVRKGEFREDLYYRINVLTIVIPPLRERLDDVRLLVDHFIEKYNKEIAPRRVLGVSPEAMQLILEYRWPGNVRELENVIERAMVLTDGDYIQVEDLPSELRIIDEGDESVPADHGLGELSLSIKKNARILEKRLIKRALLKTGGNKTKAAHMLEISLPALLYKIKDYKISV